MGVPTFDYGNNIRQVAYDEGVKNAFAFPGFVPAYIRPLFCRGIGPFRWVALSGDPEDIYRTDAKVKELIPDDPHLHRWLDMARERISFQGLPARICWVGLGQRHRLGLAFNEMVARGELKAPIVIGRDHLDSGSVASPNRETEGDAGRLGRRVRLAAAQRAAEHRERRDVGVDPSRRRRRHGLLAARGRRHRVRRHRRLPARRIERVLWNDPATGVDAPRGCGLRDSDRMRARERAEVADAMNLYDFHRGTSPLLISIPHSGTALPEALAHRLTVVGRTVPDTDWHVRPALRLRARARRVDHQGELLALRRRSQPLAGLGVAVRGRADFAGLPDRDVRRLVHLHGGSRAGGCARSRARIDEYWRPYHGRIATELAQMRAAHGKALLWDAHSIASEIPGLFEGVLPEFNLGTRDGASCPREISEALVQIVARDGEFGVVLDGRFKGGYITDHYGKPANGVYAVQLELARRHTWTKRSSRFGIRSAPNGRRR